MEEHRSTSEIVTSTPKGKIPLGRPRRKWEDIIRTGFKEMAINTTNWVDSAQDRDYWRDLVNAVVNLLISLRMWLVSYVLFNLED